jgi:hypothetical protein
MSHFIGCQITLQHGISYVSPFDLRLFLQQVMIYRKVQICKENFFSSTLWLGINRLYIAAKKGGFFIIFHLLNMEGKGRKTVGNFSQTSFRSGTRPLLSHNASPTIYACKDTFTMRN